jgi:hypothetical protein
VITVIVDFNARARGGLVKASPKHASAPVTIGQRVLAVDPDEEDMSFTATVHAIEEGRMYLAVDWEPVPDAIPEIHPTFRLARGTLWLGPFPSAASPISRPLVAARTA